MVSPGRSFGLDPAEQESLQRDGFLLRRGVFSDAECAAICADCETLFEDLKSKNVQEKIRYGNYMFERREDLGTTMKWEPEQPDLIQGIEPFVHLSAALRKWSEDPRFVEPCKAIVGEEQVALFTEKINYKRAFKGGDYIVHQDWPYWESMTPMAKRVATAMVLLDDATIANGCLEVAPGSHLDVDPPRWNEGGGRDKEIDTTRFDMTRLQPVEAARGSVIFFGSSLVHRSGPNRTPYDRRALLYSYQPVGFPHALDIKRAWVSEGKPAIR